MSIKFIQLPPLPLEAFLNTTDTSFDVSGFLYADGAEVDPDDIGDICFATLEPRTVRAELISFTIDSVTAAGVATITATRGLSQKSPYGSGGTAFEHASGSNLAISNNPGLFDKLGAKANDETITGDWKVPTPATSTSIVNKAYSDALDAANVKKTGTQTIADLKTFTTLPIIPTATPTVDGEAVSSGHLDAVAVKLTGDQTVDGIKTFSSSPVIPDAVNANQPFTKGQHDADAAASSAVASPTVRGSAKLDTGADDTLNPKVLTATADRVAALVGNGGTPDEDNTYITEEGGTVTTEVFTVDGTYTKPDHAKLIEVWLIGGGAGGAGGSGSGNDDGAPGGGGGLSNLRFDASQVGATETVTVATGGVGTSVFGTGGNGGDSSFGTLIAAEGGKGGSANSSTSTPGLGGLGNVANGSDGAPEATTSDTAVLSGLGGGSTDNPGVGRIITQPLAGGAVNTIGNSPATTLSPIGGTGGGGGESDSATGTQTGGNGAAPGGGGGAGGFSSGSGNGPGGDGARGVVIVITYF